VAEKTKPSEPRLVPCVNCGEFYIVTKPGCPHCGHSDTSDAETRTRGVFQKTAIAAGAVTLAGLTLAFVAGQATITRYGGGMRPPPEYGGSYYQPPVTKYGGGLRPWQSPQSNAAGARALSLLQTAINDHRRGNYRVAARTYARAMEAGVTDPRVAALREQAQREEPPALSDSVLDSLSGLSR
jgi:hypothetical protein